MSDTHWSLEGTLSGITNMLLLLAEVVECESAIDNDKLVRSIKDSTRGQLSIWQQTKKHAHLDHTRATE